VFHISHGPVCFKTLRGVILKTSANGKILLTGSGGGTQSMTGDFACGNTLTIDHKAANGVAPVDTKIDYGTVVSSLISSLDAVLPKGHFILFRDVLY